MEERKGLLFMILTSRELAFYASKPIRKLVSGDPAIKSNPLINRVFFIELCKGSLYQHYCAKIGVELKEI